MTSRRLIPLGRRGGSLIAALGAFMLTLGCGHEHDHAHESAEHAHPHDSAGHDEGSQLAEAEAPTESVTLASGGLELFMEHPYLVVGQGAKFNVHLTVLADGMPIRAGTLTATAKGPGGKSVTVVQEGPKTPGIYGPTIAFPEAGTSELSLVLEGPQASGTIRVPVAVYPSPAAALKAASENAEEEPEGAITFLKEQAWKIGLITEPAGKRLLVERLIVPGEITPAAGAKAVVTPPLAGRLLPPPGGAFPRVGQRVEPGQVVAIVQVLQSDLGEKLREAEIEIRKAKIELDHTRAVYERQKTLVASDAISRRQFDETERALRTAEAEYQGRLEAKRIYEESRLTPLAGTTSRGGDPGASAGAAAPAEPLPSSLLPLRAPIAGTVTSAAATQGEYVDPEHTLFTLIDLGRVWVEAKVSEFDLERVEQAPGASLTLAAYPDRLYDILGDGRGRLIDVGSVVDVATRTLPVRYELENREGVLRVGMFAEVAIQTSRREEAVAVPETAIVDEDGRPTAYVLLDGEHFQRRDLELGIRDSGFVEVRRGIEPGERVVTRGAYAIRLASVSSVIPAHGHAH
ncbi:efflux RND transporter periplasmic adaptor subunit [Tautonia sociabilis]|uniref:Efflux RND transporter periplasmic adaptor subunit n=1 Tax=Tautonia sociabilis TaxID=2080755 RepID=A0A432MIK0_9BACT|nr:efflux RND transporter periplasmic adaptor subunit [Tautonia sociabilis]RUL86976.1 efflux RND transporter periplasmic adaptor subunit [Tautonia sociabilis]